MIKIISDLSKLNANERKQRERKRKPGVSAAPGKIRKTYKWDEKPERPKKPGKIEEL